MELFQELHRKKAAITCLPVSWLDARASIRLDGAVWASPALIRGDSFSSSSRHCKRYRQDHRRAQRLHARGDDIGQSHHGIGRCIQGVLVEVTGGVNLGVVGDR